VTAQPPFAEPQIAAAKPAVMDYEALQPILRVLIVIGAAIGRTIFQQIKAGQEANAGHKALAVGANAYARISRVVRRMVLLSWQMAQPGYNGPPPRRVRKDIDTAKPDKDQDKFRDKQERLERPYDVSNGTMDDLIRRICRDLGLPPLDASHPWTSMTDEEIAALVVGAVAVVMPPPKVRRHPARARAPKRKKRPLRLWPATPPPGWGQRVPDG
jgi:hypothetical protein